MNIRKLTRYLVLIHGVQLLLGILILCAFLMPETFASERVQVEIGSLFVLKSGTLLCFGIVLMILSGLCSMVGLLAVNRMQNTSYRESMQNLENLNLRLREQRHDYLNQMQIVYGLLELEEYEDARDYLEPVFKDIMKVNRALKTAQPAVNALLQAKLEAAEKQGIDFYLEVGTKLEALPMEAWELCKVLGNLIDNAVTAVAELEGERRVSLEMHEQKETYQFVIRNNGPEIPPSMQKEIFQQGFTTKKEEGHGMGLSIVSRILKEVKGDIYLESVHEETSFFVTVPKKPEGKSGMENRLGRIFTEK